MIGIFISKGLCFLFVIKNIYSLLRHSCFLNDFIIMVAFLYHFYNKITVLALLTLVQCFPLLYSIYKTIVKTDLCSLSIYQCHWSNALEGATQATFLALVLYSIRYTSECILLLRALYHSGVSQTQTYNFVDLDSISACIYIHQEEMGDQITRNRRRMSYRK